MPPPTDQTGFRPSRNVTQTDFTETVPNQPIRRSTIQPESEIGNGNKPTQQPSTFAWESQTSVVSPQAPQVPNEPKLDNLPTIGSNPPEEKSTPSRLWNVAVKGYGVVEAYGDLASSKARTKAQNMRDVVDHAFDMKKLTNSIFDSFGAGAKSSSNGDDAGSTTAAKRADDATNDFSGRAQERMDNHVPELKVIHASKELKDALDELSTK